MTDIQDHPRRRITIAIMALGGQGGGVLADWLIAMASREHYTAQGTSVPGVAQRTGATIYYIELFPKADGVPVLALSPTPGDVDIVIAAELMEAGRAILRGFVDQNRTTLITSTHRIYAISEKSAMGNGLGNREYVLNMAEARARKFIGFDMDLAANRAGSMISPVLFGALAQSGALPFAQESFEAAIRESGIDVETNLRGFTAGLTGGIEDTVTNTQTIPQPKTHTGRQLQARVERELPEPPRALVIEGIRRLMDYQDAAYAAFYLDRVCAVAALDTEEDGWELTCEAARHIALWMSYEDTIRVADLKTRRSRFERVHGEVHAQPDQIVHVTEFMHPRLQEVCDTMPAWMGRRILSSKSLTRLLLPLFGHGRHVTTTKLRWFLMLRLIAGLRPWRRIMLRYQDEQARIESWLTLVEEAAKSDRAIALELVKNQRLIKGYGDTYARGLRNFGLIASVYKQVRGRPDSPAILRNLREAALKDEDGHALVAALAQLDLTVAAA